MTTSPVAPSRFIIIPDNPPPAVARLDPVAGVGKNYPVLDASFTRGRQESTDRGTQFSSLPPGVQDLVSGYGISSAPEAREIPAAQAPSSAQDFRMSMARAERHEWGQLLNEPGTSSESRYYMELFKVLHPGNQDPSAVSRFVEDLQNSTARAFHLLAPVDGQILDVPGRMERRLAGDNGYRPRRPLSLDQLEARYDTLSREAHEYANGEEPEDPEHRIRIIEPRINEARAAFWAATSTFLRRRHVELPCDFPAGETAQAQRMWALACKDIFASQTELELNNAAQLHLLLPDLLLFRNLQRLTINGSPVVHLPQFLAQLPQLRNITYRNSDFVDIHPDVWKIAEWDSMVNWLDRRFHLPAPGAQGLAVLAGQGGAQVPVAIFGGPPLGFLPQALLPRRNEIRVVLRGGRELDALPLRLKVRAALMCDCVPICAAVTAFVLTITVACLLCIGIGALLLLFLPELLAVIICWIILLTAVLSGIRWFGVAAGFIMVFGTLLFITLWAAIIYYLIEPLVCAVAWGCGQGWNPILRG